ncbi:hypothetical protein COLO4_24670 [Corchorus olitorius]|uniref:Uncharacterized protein n=1 Tax=Corchorus olitorius TaxID=93759 RepID=A0A1R3I8B0_9ROSI|nr:hypothetical protein COLO4_24670 [Corchorus olitorius]
MSVSTKPIPSVSDTLKLTFSVSVSRIPNQLFSILSLLNMKGPRTRRVSWSDEEENVLLQCILTMQTASGLIRSGWVERVEPT